MRLGRLAPNFAALAAAPAHDLGTEPPPTVLDRSAVPFRPGLDGNDIYGNCSTVSLANMIRAKAALGGYQAYVDPEAAVRFFAACAGNPPDLKAVDGMVYLDVINRQQAEGFNTGHDTLYGIPGTVGVDRASLAAGMVKFGTVGIGIVLHERDMAAFEAAQTWDTVQAAGDLVGGHACLVWDYTGLEDTDVVRIATWGTLFPATWRWVDAAIDEAHALAYPQEVAVPA